MINYSFRYPYTHPKINKLQHKLYSTIKYILFLIINRIKYNPESYKDFLNISPKVNQGKKTILNFISINHFCLINNL